MGVKGEFLRRCRLPTRELAQATAAQTAAATAGRWRRRGRRAERLAEARTILREEFRQRRETRGCRRRGGRTRTAENAADQFRDRAEDGQEAHGFAEPRLRIARRRTVPTRHTGG